MSLKSDYALILRDLNHIADGLEYLGVNPVGPWPLFKFECRAGSASIILKMPFHPDHIRNRVAQLESQIRNWNRGPRPQSGEWVRPRPYSLKRLPRSRRIAQQFLDDGERENWENYNLLYEGS